MKPKLFARDPALEQKFISVCAYVVVGVATVAAWFTIVVYRLAVLSLAAGRWLLPRVYRASCQAIALLQRGLQRAWRFLQPPTPSRP